METLPAPIRTCDECHGWTRSTDLKTFAHRAYQHRAYPRGYVLHLCPRCYRLLCARFALVGEIADA